MKTPVRVGSLRYGQFVGSTTVRREVNGFSLSRMVPEVPADEMPMHMHEDASFVFVIRGVYLSSAAGAGTECRGPALIFNPAGTMHRDRFERLDDATFLAISVADGTLKRAEQCARLRECATCFQAPSIVGVAHRIGAECVGWNEASPLLVEGLCLELLAAMTARQEALHKQPPAWLRMAGELLNDRYREPLRIQELAAEAAVHPVHFVRAFRRHFRCTPGEFVRRRRIERAAALLAECEESIAAVAALTGFADQSHFSKLFRKHFGVSPAEYRRAIGKRKVAN